MTTETPDIIIAENISLRVPVFLAKEKNLLSNPLQLLTDLYARRTDRKIANLLQDVSFTLRKGERLGLIGPNGAGKSTLLRMLAGIYKPSAGRLVVNGVAKGLFDMSLGMNPEATGLENIYLRGIQMGMSLSKIRRLIPDVAAFAELGEDIHKPFETYSAGMRMRLAFSISTMIEPDILLMDEWIGAVDAHFSHKVEARMNDLISNSKALVLATHSFSLMRRLCSRGLVLEGGRARFFGDIDDALAFYSETVKPA